MNGSTQAKKIDSWMRWRNWASSFARRGASRRRSPLMRVFARRSRALQVIHFHSDFAYRHLSGDTSIVVRPVIRLAVVLRGQSRSVMLRGESRSVSLFSGASDKAVGPADESRTIQTAEEITAVRRVLARLERSTREESIDTTVRNILARTRRVEEQVTVRTQFAARSGDAPAQTDPRRPQPRENTEWWRPETPPSGNRQPAQPVVNVDQIADTVLRQLDRRMGAWRERQGRM
jgi:hypothetical protein